MWSMLSQDFSDFAEAFKSESVGFMGYLEHIAANVVGRGDVYAGDEALGKAVAEMPLSNALLRRLQDTEATYTLPIQPEEKAAFAAWIKGSPLSSANALRRQQYMAAGGTTTKSEGGSPAGTPGRLPPPGMTPNRRTVEYPDEPMEETRQRLLDYNEVVLKCYMSLVGDAVSPRSSVSASPDARRWQTDPSFAARRGEGESRSPVPVAATGERSQVSSPSSAMTPARGRISEDEFFDRYFFRLTQLRVSESQRRGAAPHQKASASTSAAASPASPSAPPTPSSSPQVNDRSRQSTDEDDFAVVPLFAKRVMTAATGFVMGIDNALNSVVTVEASRCSGADGEGMDEFSEDGANVDPKDLVHYSSTRQQIAGLESTVQELQEALRQERRRVVQLASALEAQGIEVPAELLTPALSSAPITPAEKTEVTLATALMAARDTDPAPATPTGTAAAASSAGSGASAMPLAPTAAAPPLDQKDSEATSSTHSTSGDMISAATEEDTWVCMSTGAE
ncbi:conserved hypothetical protein [Leishmania infantum JPCM5]|uniref:Uncharacterized protein n=2 Tax=Leishmania infantum TaxID=5671 RepID=A4I1H1_LEIIN|nr:conserved hypothetical protein [Leishmania infantum JPCM5]CAC9494303.1 hypothetical_protein_-_conserved [Leishmania infantum]CAM68601.1 conserved hypothetical protein [Leishmania infantum JPCM5]SUZ42458.1 hypothetical_protein_-_conserved [Leishmania infantum]|eukprot:XP_001466162.1 conserved hypothetical protein [Leishmania infantum JPCM5]